MKKHTPGPWKIDSSGPTISTAEAYGTFIATVAGAEEYAPGSPEEAREIQAECDANAALIAAAPDLLASCNEMLTLMSEYFGSVHDDDDAALVMNRAEVAIAKAEATQ